MIIIYVYNMYNHIYVRIYIYLLLITYSFYTYTGITLTSWKHSTSETSLTSQLFPASWIGLLLRQPRPTNTATTRRKREGATSMLPPLNKNPNWWLKEVVFCSNYNRVMEAPLLFNIYIENVVVVHVWSCMIQVWQQVVFMSLRPWWVLCQRPIETRGKSEIFC